MKRALIAAVLLGMFAACETPPFKLVYRVSSGPVQSCGDASGGAPLTCADVPLACEAVLSIRVVDPEDPDAPYMSICEPVQQNGDGDLCSIASIDLASTPLPRRALEVQVLVWPRAMVEDPATGELDCRKYDVAFDAVGGFPLDQLPAPALGGHAYYHPGDDEVVVTLGCTDLIAVNDPVCVGTPDVTASATIDDFETGVSVSRTLGERLSVAVGEPKFNASAMEYELNPNETRRLDLVGSGPIPAWGAAIDLELGTAACIEVREDEPQATATVACAPLEAPGVLVDNRLTLHGVRLSKASLAQILAAAGLAEVPAAGLTVGIVLDSAENPQAGQVVQSTAGTVKYLNANRTGVAGTATSTSGIFISTDAPYGTDFSTMNAQFQTVSAPGGLVKGKVTIVVLQYRSGSTG